MSYYQGVAGFVFISVVLWENVKVFVEPLSNMGSEPEFIFFSLELSLFQQIH